MVPDTQRDEVIYQILLREEKVHFNDLLNKVTLEYKPITRKVLSKTLDRMSHQHIVGRDDYALESRGRKRYTWLTNDAKWQIKGEFFEGLEYKRNAERDQKKIKARKIKRAISLLLMLAGSGINRLGAVSKAEPGDLLVMDRRTGKPVICRSSSIRGISIDDIIEGRMHDPVGEIAQNLTKAVMEQSMKVLRQENFPVIIQVNSHGQLRYEIHPKFEELRDFLITSKNVLLLIVWLVRRRWLLSKKLTSSQAKWYSSLFGISNATTFFSDIDKNREYECDLLKPFFEKLLKEKNRPINVQNLRGLFEKHVKKDIESVVRILGSELQEFTRKYQLAQSIHPQFCHLVNDLIHPEFLQHIMKQGKRVAS